MADSGSTQGGTGQEPGNQGSTQQQGQEPGQGAAGQGQEPAQQQGQSGTDQGTDGFDLSSIQDPALRAYLERQQAETREARQEAARYRTERNTLAEAEQARQRQAETDQERATREATERQERLEELERENRSLRVGGAVRTAAEAARAHNPARVASLIDSQVTLNDKGEPTNVDALLTDLRTSDPYLFKAGTDQGAGAGAGAEGNAGGTMNDRIRNAVSSRRTGGQST